MDLPDSFRCLVVREQGQPPQVESLALDDLPPGDVLIRVAFSSLNYKDALASEGHRGVVKSLPHVPGIDAAGEVAASDSPDFAPGDAVLVTGYDLGAAHWGGLAEYIRVPAEWVVPLPVGLTTREAMTYGTAGFTAAQCVMAIERCGVEPSAGEVVVTGATGGVGSIAIAILAKLGYEAVAVTGKADRVDWLKQLGATRAVGRDEVDESSDRPLLSSRWSAAVDTVGGNILATILRQTEHRGCVAACGLVAGDELHTTVHPFILRGVSLAGIDSAKCPRASRLGIWRRLSGPWKFDSLDKLAREVTLDDVPGELAKMLAGDSLGRAVVRLEED